jgi:hypothetical protein
MTRSFDICTQALRRRLRSEPVNSRDKPRLADRRQSRRDMG